MNLRDCLSMTSSKTRLFLDDARERKGQISDPSGTEKEIRSYEPTVMLVMRSPFSSRSTTSVPEITLPKTV